MRAIGRVRKGIVRFKVAASASSGGRDTGSGVARFFSRSALSGVIFVQRDEDESSVVSGCGVMWWGYIGQAQARVGWGSVLLW